MVKPGFTDEWSVKNYEDLFWHIPARGHQIQTSEYCEIGKYPVVDQGQQKIISYTDEADKAIRVPIGGAIVFGDHTRLTKYIDTDFVIGADGVQVLFAKDNYSTQFLYFVLSNFVIPNTGYNRHFKFIKEGAFLVPEFQEQKRIAEALSDVDALIASLEKLIAKKNAIKQGAMQRLLTGKTRLPGFEGVWETTKIGDIAEVFSGGTPNTSNPLYWGGNIPWMNSGELNLKIVREVQGRITKDGLDNSSTHFIPPCCVLIGLAGQGKTRGTAAYNTFSLCTNQSIAAIYPNPEKFDSKFLYYKIDTKYEELRELSSGDGGRGGLTKKLILDYEVELPSNVEEQKVIAHYLTDMDNEIESLSQKLAKTRQLKQGMMQQLLTGKIRLV